MASGLSAVGTTWNEEKLRERREKNKIWKFFTFWNFLHITHSRVLSPLIPTVVYKFFTAKQKIPFDFKGFFINTAFWCVEKKFSFRLLLPALLLFLLRLPALRVRVGEETFQLMTLVKVKQTIKRRRRKVVERVLLGTIHINLNQNCATGWFGGGFVESVTVSDMNSCLVVIIFWIKH